MQTKQSAVYVCQGIRADYVNKWSTCAWLTEEILVQTAELVFHL